MLKCVLFCGVTTYSRSIYVMVCTLCNVILWTILRSVVTRDRDLSYFENMMVQQFPIRVFHHYQCNIHIFMFKRNLILLNNCCILIFLNVQFQPPFHSPIVYCNTQHRVIVKVWIYQRKYSMSDCFDRVKSSEV